MLKIIGEFDLFLADKNIHFSGIIIGGAALNIMNITTRVTKDVDFIEPVLTDEIKTAAKEFIQLNPTYRLDPNQWLNNGPISIEELNPCLPWVVEGDGNPLWKQRVLSPFKILNKALGYEQ
jgi:hypothetical protein